MFTVKDFRNMTDEELSAQLDILCKEMNAPENQDGICIWYERQFELGIQVQMERDQNERRI